MRLMFTCKWLKATKQSGFVDRVVDAYSRKNPTLLQEHFKTSYGNYFDPNYNSALVK